MLPQPLHLPLHSPSVCPSTAPPSALPQPLHPPTHRPSIHSAPTLPCQDLTVWITEESRNCTTNSAGASLQRHRCTSAAPPPAAQASAPQNGISFPKQHLPGPSGLSSPSPLPPPRPPQARARALHPSLGTVCPVLPRLLSPQHGRAEQLTALPAASTVGHAVPEERGTQLK